MSTSLPLASTSDAPPMACTLGGAAFADRVAWISALNRTALRSHSREDRTLRLTYAPTAAPQVHQLVAQERECCAFLRFQIDETPSGVHLRMEAPEEGRDALDALFAPFLVGTETAAEGAS